MVRRFNHLARDVADNQVKGFIVENKTTPGFSVEKIEHKIALKVVQNGQITLRDVRVPETNRLQAGNSFRDTARVLRMTRYMVGWASTGIQMGAFEATLKYAQERLQFGEPIASFQMVQDLLAKMLANVTACQCLMVRLAQLDDEGKLSDHQAALAKAFCTAKSRETVSWGASCWAATALSPTTTSRASSRTLKLSTHTKARIRCRIRSLEKPSLGLELSCESGRARGPPHPRRLAASFQTGDATMASPTAMPTTSSPGTLPIPSEKAAWRSPIFSMRRRAASPDVTVNRPKVLNALNTPTWRKLQTAFEDARDDAAVRGVILTGAGDKAFIAGADIGELARTSAFEAEQSSRFGQGVLDLIEKLASR